ncbi:MAG: xanthine dehydrogenase family protein molybdopterin-binding subunit [Pseudomonadota bacterium]
MTDMHKIETALTGIIVADDGAPLALPENGIGSPQRRMDGPDKVTGHATYAGEDMPNGTLHAVLVTSPVAKGRIAAIDTGRARAAPGVVRVLTPVDMPTLGSPSVPPTAQSKLPMSSLDIDYEGQPIAIVLAETLEQAEAGAGLVRIGIERAAPAVFNTAEVEVPPTEGNGYVLGELDPAHGDVDAGFANAAHRIEATYTTPTRHHNMMEPSVTLAEWRGGDLYLNDATQWSWGLQLALSGIFEMEPNRIHIRCPYTGGGFGAKGYVWPHQILAPIAARIVGRPVKLNLTRTGCYTGCGYQSGTQSRLRLASDAQGRLTAVEHHTENVTSISDDYIEFANIGTRGMYAMPAYRMTTRVRRANVGTPTAMRAPHEGPGMFALESAMDELAYEIGMDPLELRLANYTDSDPHSGKPFSSNKLLEAYAEGARRIGWSDRVHEPRSRRDGDKLLGLGMAGAIMTTFRNASQARVATTPDGRFTVEVGSQEIGTGTRTIFAQVVAERLGVPSERVTVVLGSTDLPPASATLGSASTISIGSAVATATDNLKTRLDHMAGRETRPDEWPDLLARLGVDRVQAEGAFTLPGDVSFDAHGGQTDYSMHTWGAVFVEMEVDEITGIARMRRAVAAYSAGRILNPVTARSQMIGGIIFGYGRAMLEASPMDPRYGRYLSKNLSGVQLPVNADIPRNIDVCFIEEHDPHASAIGVRGIGELGEVGVAAAITNAIYNATGKRVRDLPVHFEHLIA